ncbi:MAG: PAS domain-containing sensor histidine kinase [Planctomycetota bacterium]
MSSPLSAFQQPHARDPLGRSLGFGLLVLTAVMGAALVATTASGYRAARQATDSLARGQGDALWTARRGDLRQVPERPPSAAALATLLGEGEDGEPGIACVAVFDPVSGQTAVAGQSAVGVERLLEAARQGESGDLTLVGTQAVLIKRLPPNAAQRARHPDALPPTAELDRVALEFTPRAAQRLQSAAVLTVGVGASATLVLLLTAVAFARLLRRRAELEEALGRERQLAALGEMSVVLAHEIKNPLASLKGHAQLLAESLDEGTPERRKTDRVVSEAIRLQELCDDLLDFVRTAQVAPAPTALEGLVRGCVEALGAERVTLELSAAPAEWSLDAARMRHVLTNLLRNALEADPAGAVALRASQEGGALVLVVRDRGPGLPPGEEERVFQPFFTKRTQGTGLGLAVARRVVELHGGTIAARTHPEGGAELTVRIPASAAGRGR